MARCGFGNCSKQARPGGRRCERHTVYGRLFMRQTYDETRARPDGRRCGLCRQLGHNATTCGQPREPGAGR